MCTTINIEKKIEYIHSFIFDINNQISKNIIILHYNNSQQCTNIVNLYYYLVLSNITMKVL